MPSPADDTAAASKNAAASKEPTAQPRNDAAAAAILRQLQADDRGGAEYLQGTVGEEVSPVAAAVQTPRDDERGDGVAEEAIAEGRRLRNKTSTPYDKAPRKADLTDSVAKQYRHVARPPAIEGSTASGAVFERLLGEGGRERDGSAVGGPNQQADDVQDELDRELQKREHEVCANSAHALIAMKDAESAKAPAAPTDQHVNIVEKNLAWE